MGGKEGLQAAFSLNDRGDNLNTILLTRRRRGRGRDFQPGDQGERTPGPHGKETVGNKSIQTSWEKLRAGQIKVVEYSLPEVKR